MLELRDVSKMYQKQPLVEKISFVLIPGEVLGLLSPAAAGKTTIIRLMIKMIKPDAGEIIYDSKPIKKVPKKIFGYMPQIRGIYQRAKLIKYLVYVGVLNQLSKARARQEAFRYLDRFNMLDLADIRIAELSTQIQEKIQIISCLLHDPDVLVIDEPFAGFSPPNDELIENVIREFKQKSKLVCIASRFLDKAQNICDRVCFLNKGKLVLNLTQPEIQNRVRNDIYYLESEDNLTFLKTVKEVQLKEADKGLYRITIRDKNFDVQKLVSLLNKNIRIKKFEQFQPDLSEIYNRLIKNLQKQKS